MDPTALDADLPIQSLQFSVLSAEQIRKQSVVEVKHNPINYKNLPKEFGVNDHRMGTVDRRIKCGTCGHSIKECNGHPGHIELHVPVYHPGFIKTVLHLLRCVCFFCSRLLIRDETDYKKLEKLRRITNRRRRRFEIVRFLSGKATCFYCGGYQPSYKFGKIAAYSIQREWTSKSKSKKKAEEKFFECPEEEKMARKQFTSMDAYEILAGMSDEDCRRISFPGRPEDLIPVVLVVPPPIIRPSITAHTFSRSRGHNDLTKKLHEIGKYAEMMEKLLKKHKNAFDLPTLPDAVQKTFDTLQWHVATYINNDGKQGVKPDKQRSGIPKKSLFTRIKGKKGKVGRIRGNLMGKRVNFSARTVITPDPTLDMDEIGVPEEIALNVSIPETVASCNLGELRTRVYNGPNHLNGALTVIKGPLTDQAGKCIHLRYCKNRKTIRLELGDTVERPLKNGDYVMMNRQPSLHKQSLMAHRVKIFPKGKTFRLNLCVTTPYNADFDGDEMNMFIIQSVEGRAELKEICAVHRQLLTPQSNKPCMGLVQDALLGSYLLTRRNTFLNREDLMNCLMTVRYQDIKTLPKPAILKPECLWTGKQLYSLLLPLINLRKTVRSTRPRSYFDPEERHVLIRHGELVSGALSKQMLGTSSGGIIHAVCKDHGFQKAAEFLSDIQRVVNYWMMFQGFSVGISDCVIDEKTEAKVGEIVKGAYRTIETINRHVEELPNAETISEELETQINGILCKVLDSTGSMVQENLSDNNRIYAMQQAGSKGNAVNVSQIMACVGQQSIGGSRIHGKIDRRTLNCYPKGCKSASSHGFVGNSYIRGLTPQEFFFHTAGGREGLVDTAVKTADTGYIQRKLLKGMESLRVHQDYSVRNAQGYIIALRYGNDAADATFLEKCKLDFLEWDNQQLQEEIQFPEEIEALHGLRDALRFVKTNPMNPVLSTVVYVPVDIKRLLLNAGSHFGRTSEDLEVSLVHEAVTELCEKIRIANGIASSLFFRAAIRFFLSTINVNRHQLSEEAFRYCLDKIDAGFFQSRISPNEMVGPLAAESIGEPCTQLTLNAFHLAGIETKNVTLGIPRMNELINCSRHMATPCATVMLRKPFCDNKAFLETFAETLPRILLNDTVSCGTVVFDPDPIHTCIEQDKEIVRLASPYYDGKEEKKLSEWIIRLDMDRFMLMKKSITVVALAKRLQECLRKLGVVERSENNMPEWTIRIRLYYVPIMQSRLQECEDISPSEQRDIAQSIVQGFMTHLLENFVLGGIQGITGATIRRQEITEFNDATGEAHPAMRYVIDTEGTNLSQLWRYDAIDWANTISNNVNEVWRLLGIAAAQNVLFHEIKTVLSYDGSYINDRHIMMVVRTMTFRGFIMPLNRFGMNRIDTGVTVRASFEEAMDMFLEAAMFEEQDELKGITENIIVGQLAPMGTGAVSVRTDPDYQEAMSVLPSFSVHARKDRTNEPVWRSVLTTWESTYLKSSMHAFHDRPPSPSHAPQWLSTPVSDAGDGSIIIPTERNETPTRTRQQRRGQKRKFRPSTPELQSPSQRKRCKFRPSSPDPLGVQEVEDILGELQGMEWVPPHDQNVDVADVHPDDYLNSLLQSLNDV